MMTVNPAHSFVYEKTRINVYHADSGHGLPKHEHTYSHATVCATGKIIVRKDGMELIMTKSDQPIDLAPDEWHEIEAIEDGTVFLNIFIESNL